MEGGVRDTSTGFQQQQRDIDADRGILLSFLCTSGPVLSLTLSWTWSSSTLRGYLRTESDPVECTAQSAHSAEPADRLILCYLSFFQCTNALKTFEPVQSDILENAILAHYLRVGWKQGTNSSH